MLTPEQKEARRHGIGGSDAAAILGLSPWSSAFDVFMRLTGVETEEQDNERLEWGHILEPVIVRQYERRVGLPECRVVRPVRTFRHRDYPWMIANLDGAVPGPDGTGVSRLLEIKTVGTHSAHHWGPEGTDQIPDYYLPQVAHYMAVLDVDVCDVAAFFGDFSMRIYTVPRDRDFEQVLIEEEAALWARVQANQPPPIDGSSGCKEWLRQRYPRDERPIEDAAGAEIAALIEFQEADALAEAAAARLAKAKNEVIACIADRKGLQCDLGRVTYGADKNGKRSLRATWRKA